MDRFTLWDKQEGFTLISGTTLTVEQVHERYPFTSVGPVMLEHTQHGTVCAIDNLDILRTAYNIPETATDEEAFDQIVELRTNPPVTPEPTPGPGLDEIKAQIAELTAAQDAMMEGLV